MLCSEMKDMDKYGDNGIIQGIKVLDKNIESAKIVRVLLKIKFGSTKN